MDWFRSYHGAPTDPKWRLVAKRVGCRPGDVAAIWWALMDHASQADDRGSIADFDPEVLAEAYGYELETVRNTIETLRNMKVVSAVSCLVSWERRNPKPGVTSTERVRRHRLKIKGENVSETGETITETTKRPRSEQNRDKKEAENLASLGKVKRRLTDEERELASAFNGGSVPWETTDEEVALWRERAKRKLAAKVVPLPVPAETPASEPSPAPQAEKLPASALKDAPGHQPSAAPVSTHQATQKSAVASGVAA